ncbi:MAG: hypothetical protein KGY76_06510 [Candidatus Thermoplasmatota archaeon]|nr:hypothetical protein [Candidatus Thermoplasmatota archaeon]
MKTLAVDTAALVSLGHTDLVDAIIENYDILISKSVLEELEEIGARDDLDAEAARVWLDRSSDLNMMNLDKKDSAEDELFEVCREKDLELFTDDIKAVKTFKDDIDCLFSVHIVYLLYKKDIISKEKALFSVDKMKTNRDWKQNIIAITSKTLF